MLLNGHGSRTLKQRGSQSYEVVKGQRQKVQSFEEYHRSTFSCLEQADREVYELIAKEYERWQNTLQLIAGENQCSLAVLAALGSVVQNKTGEGFPGARLHGGCGVVDEVEGLAIARAKEAFGAKYVNVQPHSGTTANQIVLTAALQSGDKILSLGPDEGGHYSHGSNVSLAGKYFEVENYHLNSETFLLDYDAIRQTAVRFQPKLIICGASAYSRTIDFRTFRDIADEVGAYLLADVSHLSGLVIAGAHPSPVNHAHFVTTSTYKPGGPRGGLIVMGKDYDREIKVGARSVALWEHIDETTFPGMQGTPYLNNVAAKAVLFKEMLSPEYKARQFKIIENAKGLAECLVDLGYDVVTGGTDNHMILVNVANFRKGLTGIIAQRCLEDCGIVVNMIRLPYDKHDPAVTGGMRLGTPVVTKNGMGPEQMKCVAALVDGVLRRVEIISETEYRIDESFKTESRDKVKDLCSRFPMC